MVGEALAKLLADQSLCEAEARRLIDAMFAGTVPQAQVAAALALLARRGPTVEELTGAARALRQRVLPVPVDAAALAGPLIDTCGTGGAGKRLNVSTAAALVAAACRGASRVYVAKHGNRSRTGRGSAETLAALGVNVDASPAAQARCLQEAGVCFCFAVRHHPAMKQVAQVRRALKFPTIFNLLGPLTNPAGARRQLLGVYDARFGPLLAQTLAQLGCERAIVAHGEDGLDELTIAGPSRLWVVDEQGVREERVVPEDAGLRTRALDAPEPRSVDEAAALLRRVLAGQETGALGDIVALNAAGALLAAGVVEDLREGAALAREAIASGAALRVLEALVAGSQRA